MHARTSSAAWAAVVVAVAAGICSLVLLSAPYASHAAREEALMTDSSLPPPWPVLAVASSAQTFLNRVSRKLAPPFSHVMDVTCGFITASALGAAAFHDVAEALAVAPLTAAELAAARGLVEEDTSRVMELLVSVGIFEKLHGKYRNNAASSTLRDSHPNSARAVVLAFTDDHYQPFWYLSDHLSLGAATEDPTHTHTHTHARPNMWRRHHGTTLWGFYGNDPVREKRFSLAMMNVDNMVSSSLVRDYHWGMHKRVVDIAGASGKFAARILEANPHMQAVVFDLDRIVARYNSSDTDTFTAQRNLTFVGGDFFDADTLPELLDGDVVVLRNILHDWDDADSAVILSNLHSRAVGKSVHLAIVEQSLYPDTVPASWLHPGALTKTNVHQSPVFNKMKRSFDLIMMLFGGKERSVDEMHSMLKGAGWLVDATHALTYPTRSPFVVITATS